MGMEIGFSNTDSTQEALWVLDLETFPSATNPSFRQQKIIPAWNKLSLLPIYLFQKFIWPLMLPMIILSVYFIRRKNKYKYLKY